MRIIIYSIIIGHLIQAYLKWSFKFWTFTENQRRDALFTCIIVSILMFLIKEYNKNEREK